MDMSDNVIELDARKVRERPSPTKEARLVAMRAAEATHGADDAVFQAAAGATTVELLRLQVVELAREAAALRWAREHSSDARDRQRLSSRRIRALRTVATAVIELHRLEGGEPSPAVLLRVLDDLQGVVETCAGEVFEPATVERFVCSLRDRLGPAVAQVVSRAGCV